MRAWQVRNRVGESPTWNHATQELLWIDVRAPAVLRLNPRTSMVTRWELPEVVGALGLAGETAVVLALTRRIAILDLYSGRLSSLITLAAEPSGNRLNDGKVSPSGRWFVFGSMGDPPTQERPSGALYCVGTDLSVRLLRAGLGVANGIAWSPDAATLYFSDSRAGVVWRASWDDDTGTMGSARQLCLSDEGAGRPDGAATDAGGDYWSAGVSAGCLNRFAPDGRLKARQPLPCRAPSMLCFGGSKLNRLFVTSLVRPEWDVDSDCLDGAVFELAANTEGTASANWALNLDEKA